MWSCLRIYILFVCVCVCVCVCTHFVPVISACWVVKVPPALSKTKSNLIVSRQLAYVIYRYFRKRSVHSMNFDNPVYKKTTTEDGFHLAGQQRNVCSRASSGGPQFQHRQYGVTSPEDVSTCQYCGQGHHLPPHHATQAQRLLGVGVVCCVVLYRW